MHVIHVTGCEVEMIIPGPLSFCTATKNILKLLRLIGVLWLKCYQFGSALPLMHFPNRCNYVITTSTCTRMCAAFWDFHIRQRPRLPPTPIRQSACTPENSADTQHRCALCLLTIISLQRQCVHACALHAPRRNVTAFRHETCRAYGRAEAM